MERHENEGGGRAGSVLKLVFCVRRRANLTVEEFERYWLDSHGSLVKSVAGTLSMKRYVQSHLLRGELTALLNQSRGAAEPYDGIAEVWFDASDLDAEMTEAELVANIQLLEDERRFIDLERSTGFFTVEHEVF